MPGGLHSKLCHAFLVVTVAMPRATKYGFIEALDSIGRLVTEGRYQTPGANAKRSSLPVTILLDNNILHQLPLREKKWAYIYLFLYL